MTELRYEYCRGKYRHYIQNVEEDGVWREGYIGTYGEFDLDKITVLLNELNNENKELKQKLEDCKFAHRTEMAHHRVVEKELEKENEQLKLQNSNLMKEVAEYSRKAKEERDTAMRLGSECDNLTIKNQKLELEIQRLEMIIKTGKR